jgi:hypothetical protein
VLPMKARNSAFAQMMVGQGAPVLASRSDARPWDGPTDMLEGMSVCVGFSSADLAAVTVPCLVVTGGRSHPRFAASPHVWSRRCRTRNKQPSGTAVTSALP